MEQKTDNRKKIVKAVIWVAVVLTLMATIHIAINYFDLFELLQGVHGG